MEDAKKIKDIMVPIEEYEKVYENDALCKPSEFSVQPSA